MKLLIFSYILFSIYDEIMTDDALEKFEIRMRSKRIEEGHIRFANENTLARVE